MMAVNLNPFQWYSQAQLGRALLRLGQIDEAFSALQFAVNRSRDRTKCRVWAPYARVLALKGKDAEARSAIEKIVTLGEKWRSGRGHLSRCGHELRVAAAIVW